MFQGITWKRNPFPNSCKGSWRQPAIRSQWLVRCCLLVLAERLSMRRKTQNPNLDRVGSSATILREKATLCKDLNCWSRRTLSDWVWEKVGCSCISSCMAMQLSFERCGEWWGGGGGEGGGGHPDGVCVCVCVYVCGQAVISKMISVSLAWQKRWVHDEEKDLL